MNNLAATSGAKLRGMDWLRLRRLVSIRTAASRRLQTALALPPRRLAIEQKPEPFVMAEAVGLAVGGEFGEGPWPFHAGPRALR